MSGKKAIGCALGALLLLGAGFVGKHQLENNRELSRYLENRYPGVVRYIKLHDTGGKLRQYTIRPNDNLDDLSGRFYGTSELSDELEIYIRMEQGKDFSQLRTGDHIYIPEMLRGVRWFRVPEEPVAELGPLILRDRAEPGKDFIFNRGYGGKAYTYEVMAEMFYGDRKYAPALELADSRHGDSDWALIYIPAVLPDGTIRTDSMQLHEGRRNIGGLPEIVALDSDFSGGYIGGWKVFLEDINGGGLDLYAVDPDGMYHPIYSNHFKDRINMGSAKVLRYQDGETTLRLGYKAIPRRYSERYNHDFGTELREGSGLSSFEGLIRVMDHMNGVRFDVL